VLCWAASVFSIREKIVEIYLDCIYAVYTFDAMKAKRRLKTYKAYDEVYELAKNKAALTDKPLATRIEDFVFKYAGVEKSHYFAAMGSSLIKESNRKKK
jgi:hypothetical protein